MRDKGQYVSINEVVRTIRDTLGLKSALNEQIFGDGVLERFDQDDKNYKDVLYSFNVIKTCLCNNTMTVKKFGKLFEKK